MEFTKIEEVKDEIQNFTQNLLNGSRKGYEEFYTLSCGSG
jgi:hypothetical protein